jgi:hypothetical protein
MRKKILKDKYFNIIKNIILDYYSDDIKIILFGSRARGTNNNNSDYDICLISGHCDNKRRISLINEKIENSAIPFKVDIVDYNILLDSFKEMIDNEGIVCSF